MLKFSAVIPIYNEEGSIIELYFSLKEVLGELGGSYEIIFVNDGSQDRSLEILRSLNLKSSDLVIVNLNKHKGQSIAMQAGFDVAQGELIITMDGDLQDDPRDIPRLLDKMNANYDVVCGWRFNRKDPRSKLLLSKINRIMHQIIFRENIHDPGCTLRVFKKETIKDVFLFTGAHRFFTLIMVKLGYKVGELKIEHHWRRCGRSKYNIYNRFFEWMINFILFSLFDIHKLMRRRPYLCSILYLFFALEVYIFFIQWRLNIKIKWMPLFITI